MATPAITHLKFTDKCFNVSNLATTVHVRLSQSFYELKCSVIKENIKKVSIDILFDRDMANVIFYDAFNTFSSITTLKAHLCLISSNDLIGLLRPLEKTLTKVTLLSSEIPYFEEEFDPQVTPTDYLDQDSEDPSSFYEHSNEYPFPQELDALRHFPLTKIALVGARYRQTEWLEKFVAALAYPEQLMKLRLVEDISPEREEALRRVLVNCSITVKEVGRKE